LSRDEAAWALVHALVAELKERPGVVAIAATGSLARGDFGAGSDVDLWVIAAENSREDFVRDGVDVSLLGTSEDYAQTLECALRFEIAQVVSLHDPRGVLAALVRRVESEADVLREEMHRAAQHVFARLADVLEGGDDVRLVRATLRESARRGAAAFLYGARGWRVPKWRHFEQVLFPRDLERFRLVANLEAVDTAGLLAALGKASAEPAPSPQWPWPDSPQVERYLKNGRPEDAIIAVRQALPPLPDAGLDALTDAARQLFESVHNDSDPLVDVASHTGALLGRWQTASLGASAARLCRLVEALAEGG